MKKRARMTLVYILLILIIGLLGYIRLAPSNAGDWHKPITVSEDKDFAGGAIRIIPAGEGTLARIDAAAQALDRTEVLAGSVAEGRITYVTRTARIGFPDYTTIEQDGDQIKLYARLRFGRSDLGVNIARIQALIAAAQG